MDWLAWLNPLNYVSQEDYLLWWEALSQRFLVGLPLRVLTLSFLGASYWCGIYKLRMASAIVLFLLAMITAYLHPWMQAIGLQ